jgi:tetratricopeptide (TPR) repeat protein
MIVKDEAKVIERCLRSVRPIVDCCVICDTGSQDGTQAIVRALFEATGLPGRVVDRPWRDFAHNRNEGIALARETFPEADYLLFMDADEELHLEDPAAFRNLTLDAYETVFHYAELHYPRINLVAARKPWTYVGVLHEYLQLDPPYSCAVIPGAHVQVRPEGARSADPEKYLKDARILREALVQDPLNARYQFYLAQSLRDAGQIPEAIAAYRQRVELAGWEEEVWYAKFQLARLLEQSTQPVYGEAAIIEAYMQAIQARPGRTEAYGCLARYLRSRNAFATAHFIASQGMRVPPTTDKLFVEPAYAEWICEDEFAVSGYWCGRYQEALASNERLRHRVPASEQERIAQNLAFCLARLGSPATD